MYTYIGIIKCITIQGPKAINRHRSQLQKKKLGLCSLQNINLEIYPMDYD